VGAFTRAPNHCSEIFAGTIRIRETDWLGPQNGTQDKAAIATGVLIAIYSKLP
jgi:hypothetical protein